MPGLVSKYAAGQPHQPIQLLGGNQLVQMLLLLFFSLGLKYLIIKSLYLFVH